MKVILFGASGMVGQGVLRECLLDSKITEVMAVNRTAMRQSHPKLRELVHPNFDEFSSVEPHLTGYDACFYSIGITALGTDEATYTRITHDFTMSAARVLARLNPNMTFVFVSASGADATEKGAVMWARVKGKTENELAQLPFKASYVFRPALIQPLHGIASKTAWYRLFYLMTAPVIPFLLRMLPTFVTTTERLGKAMIAVAHNGTTQRILYSRDINRLGESISHD